MAGLLAVALMGLLLRSGSWRGAPSGRPEAPAADPLFPAPDGPEDRVRSLLEHARNGDLDGYLADFTGSLRSRLEREASEQGREVFATELRKAAEARKSHAVFAAQADAPESARVTVESVYPDRNERQTFRLENTSDGWRVAEFETIRARQPAFRFGTPATFDGPDGPPVATARTSDASDLANP